MPPLLADRDTAAIVADLRAFAPSLMAEARIPGLQIALVRDGRLAWQGSFGVRSTATGAAAAGEPQNVGQAPPRDHTDQWLF